ncbi:MAG: GGDEF domain-containing protein [Treponemataceae bacterium]
MDKQLASELRKIIEEFFYDSKDSVRYVSCDCGILRKIKEFMPQDAIIVDMMSPLTRYSPFAPFLEILRKVKISNAEIDKRVYSLQKETFKSFVATGTAKSRKDMFVKEEVYYERFRIKTAIYDLYSSNVKTPLIIYNAQLMDEDGLDIIKMLEKSHKGKLLLYFDFSRFRITSETPILFAELTSKDNYYEIVRKDVKTQSDLKFVIEESNFYTFENLYKCFLNCKNFLSLDTSSKLAIKILQERDFLNCNSEERAKIFMEISQIFYYADDIENAYAALNIAISQIRDKKLKKNAIFYLVPILYERKAYFDALKYCEYLSSEEDDDGFSDYTLALLFKCKIYYKTNSPNFESCYKETISKLKRKFKNNFLTAGLLFSVSKVKGNEKKVEKFLDIIEENLKIGEKIGNENAYACYCHKKASLLLTKGRAEEALQWFDYADKIRRRVDDCHSIVNIRNDMAYEHILIGDFLSAFKIMLDISDEILAMTNYSEIINTLNTIAKTYFFIGYFAECQRLLNSITKIMQIYNYNNEGVCTINDISIMLALIDVYYSKFNHAHVICENVKVNGKGYSDFSSLILMVTESVILLHDKKQEEAVELFSKAENFFMKKIPEQKSLYAFIEYFFANMLYRFGFEELSKKYREKADDYAMEEALVFFIINYKDVPTRRIYTLDFSLQQFLVSLKKLEKQSVRIQVMNSLQKRIRDSKFLNKLIEISNSELARDEYIKRTLNEISDYVLCKGIYFAEISEETGEWIVVQQITRDATYFPKEEDWKYLMIKTSNADVNFIAVNENTRYYNLSKFDSVAAIIIEFNDEFQYSETDMNIFKMGLASIQSQLTIINQQEHLRIISSTDRLSRLNNRWALEEELELENDMMRRCKGKGLSSRPITVIFIDLDHFKFYNDTYGHESGDKLIRSFSTLLKKIYRRGAFVSRYGGDEFVVLLPNTDSQKAYHVTERLRSALVEEDYFLPVLEKELDIKREMVPPDQYISFSAGICSNIDLESPETMSDILGYADKALYYAKENGRSKTVLWTEIQ